MGSDAIAAAQITFDQAQAGALQGGGEAGGLVAAHIRQAELGCGMREIELVVGADELPVPGNLRHRQEVEDRAAAVVEHDDRALAASQGERIEIVQAGEIADQADAAPAAAGTEEAGDGAVDAVEPAIAQHPTIARGQHQVGVAHRHAARQPQQIGCGGTDDGCRSGGVPAADDRQVVAPQGGPWLVGTAEDGDQTVDGEAVGIDQAMGGAADEVVVARSAEDDLRTPLPGQPFVAGTGQRRGSDADDDVGLARRTGVERVRAGGEMRHVQPTQAAAGVGQDREAGGLGEMGNQG